MGHLHHTKDGRKNKHFTYKERLRIEVMHKEKLGTKKISEAIGCSQRSVQWELKRGSVTQLNGSTWIYYESYSADIGHNRYERQNARSWKS